MNSDNKYFASVLLGIVGDQIGFGNGEREFFLQKDIPPYKSQNFNITINSISYPNFYNM